MPGPFAQHRVKAQTQKRSNHSKKDDTDHKTSGYSAPDIGRIPQHFKLALLLWVSSC
jgi:hypothetical protein